MKRTPHDDGEGLSAFEERLRGCLPGPLPDGFVAALESRGVARGSVWRVRGGWLAVAALLVAGFWFGTGFLDWLNRGGVKPMPNTVSAATESPTEESGESGLVEMTDVIAAEDAGTAPSDGGLYRIVRVMLVHRTVEKGVEAEVLRVISEEISEQYVAVPLEIF
jgi:hypothetical protein